MPLTIQSGYTVNSGEVWTPTKHNLSTTIAIQQATTTLTGRTTAGTGTIEELTPAQARAILGLSTTDSPGFLALAISNTSILNFIPNGTAAFIGTSTNHPIRFYINNGGTVAEITTTGLNNTAIGATTRAAGAFTTLAANGAVTVEGAAQGQVYYQKTGVQGVTIGSDAASQLFFFDTAERMRLTSSGLTVNGTGTFTGICSAVSFNATSSRRTKKNIRTFAHDPKRLLGLRPVWYDEKRLGGKEQLVGFIAEELNKYLPGMVAKDPDQRATGINYGPLVSVAIASLQNHERRLTAIEARQKHLR